MDSLDFGYLITEVRALTEKTCWCFFCGYKIFILQCIGKNSAYKMTENFLKSFEVFVYPHHSENLFLFWERTD